MTSPAREQGTKPPLYVKPCNVSVAGDTYELNRSCRRTDEMQKPTPGESKKLKKNTARIASKKPNKKMTTPELNEISEDDLGKVSGGKFVAFDDKT
jgi:hypothetical protein